MRKILIMIVLCIAGTFLNILITKICFHFGIPLYLDTILTISITMTCGLFWGILCGLLTNFIHHTIWGWGWLGYLFIICNIATAFVTWLLMKLFPSELNLTPNYLKQTISKQTEYSVHKSSLFDVIMDRIIILIIMSFALCLVMSFLGGFIAAIISLLSSSYSYNFSASGIGAIFSSTMFSTNTPIIVSEIVSRIPVNVVDRSISAFGGYGIALCIKRLLEKINSPLYQK